MYNMPCKLKYRSWPTKIKDGVVVSVINKRYGKATGNNTKKKICMFHRGIPKIPGVTFLGKEAKEAA